MLLQILIKQLFCMFHYQCATRAQFYGGTKAFSGGPKNCLNKNALMKGIFHRVLRRSLEKKAQSTNEILLPVIGGKKFCYLINFACYWTILRLQGTLNASVMGNLEGEIFVRGVPLPPCLRLSPLYYSTFLSASFSSNSKIVSHVFIVLMKSKMKISSLRVPWKKPILLLRMQKAVNTNICKRLIKDLP